MTAELLQDLTNNATPLLALAMLHNTLRARRQVHGTWFGVLTGMLFGATAIIGMAFPFVLSSGLIFDSRSVVLSLAGLFGGPLVAGVAALMAIAYRSWLGGVGTFTGVAVILSATSIGIAAHWLKQRGRLKPGLVSFLGLGLFVHLVSLLWMLSLPNALFGDVMRHVAGPFLSVLTLSTLVFAHLFQLGEDQELAAKSLAESEERFRKLVEGSLVGVYVIQGRRVAYANPALDEIFGYPEGGLEGQMVRTLVAPDSFSEVYERLQRQFDDTPGSLRYSFQAVKADRTAFVAEVFGSRALYGGKPAIVGMLLDVTERQQAARRLSESERLLRESQTVARIGSYQYDFRTRCYTTSAFVDEMLGLKPGQAKSDAAWLDLVDPGYRAEVERQAMEAAGQNDSEQTYPIIRPRDGQRRWLHSVARTERDGAGRPSRVVGIIQDVTERREAELAAESSESKFRVLVNAIPDLVWLKDPQGVFLTCNRQFERFMGRSEAEVIGKTDFDFVDHELAVQFRADDKRVLESGRTIVNEERLQGAIHGEPRLLEAVKTPLYGATGDLIGVLGVARDITQRKAVEDALRLSERLHRRAQRVAQIGHWELDHRSRELHWSDEVYRIFERDPKSFTPDFESSLEATHPDDREWVKAAFEDAAKRGKQYQLIHRIQQPSGEIKYVEERAQFVMDSDGTPLRTVGTAQDVTERRRVQLDLERQLHNNRLMLDTMTDGYLRLDAQGNILDVNQAYCHMLGYEKPELLGHNISEFRVESNPLEVSEIATRVIQAKQHRFETHHRRKDGGVILFESSATAMPGIEPAQVVAFLRDVTEQRSVEAHYRELVNRIPAGVFRYRSDCLGRAHLEYVSPAFCKLLGIRESEALGDPERLFGRMHPDDVAAFQQLRKKARGEAESFSWDGRLNFEDRIRWVHVEAGATRDIDGSLVWHGIATDVTERQLLLDRMRLDSAVIASTTESIMVTDLEANIVSVNKAFTDVTGYVPADVLGKNTRVLKSGRHDETYYQAMWRDLLALGHWQGQIWSRRKSGEIYPELLNISVVRGTEGEPTHYVGVASDISSLKRSEEQLAHLAHHDALTGLPNRLLLASRVEHAVEQAQRAGQQIAVLFMDLDRFKTVNDSLGHPIGDRLLVAVAQRLRSRLREDDTLGRLGGDEFLILLERLDNSSDAAMLGEALLESLTQPFKLGGGYELYIQASIGISVYPADGDTGEILIRNADAAMFRAKDQGRNTLRFYTEALTQQASRRLELETQMRRALEQGDFMVWYQPIYRFSERRIIGAEALLRWRGADGRLISPEHFIPVAEDSGLILELGRFVLEMACRDLKRWIDSGLRIETLAVNLSPQQLRGQNLEQGIAELITTTGAPAHCLELEITERGLMDLGQDTLEKLDSLKALGVQLAIDDFGTGYSSLSYLKRMPVDKLKIDRSFVEGLPADTSDVGIVQTIIAIARTMQLRVLAEGVEGRSQLDFLREAGCEECQGFLFGPAVPSQEFVTQFKAGTCLPPHDENQL